VIEFAIFDAVSFEVDERKALLRTPRGAATIED
jgi:hypothetical protein